MPFTKRRGVRRFRKNVRRPRGRRMRMYKKPTSLVGPKDKYFCKLRYVSNISSSMTVGGYTYHRYQWNSLYKPDYDSPGHQPYYYDQLMAMYKTYRVLACKYKVRMAVSAGATKAVVYFNNENTFFASVETAMESKRVNAKDVAVGFPITLKGYTTVAALWGLPKRTIMSEALFSGTSGVSPGNLSYLTINLFEDGIGAVTYSANIELDLYCMFSGLVLNSGS